MQRSEEKMYRTTVTSSVFVQRSEEKMYREVVLTKSSRYTLIPKAIAFEIESTRTDDLGSDFIQ